MKKKDNNQVTENVQTVTRKKKKRKKAPIIIAIIVVVFIVFYMAIGAMMPETAAFVTTTTATRGDLQDSISTSGTVASEEKKVIFAPVSGSLAEVNVAAGDVVLSGDVLITYNMEDMEKSFKQASLQYTKSDASYQGAMADDSESQAKLEEANTNLKVLEQQIEDHEAWLERLQEDLSESNRGSSNALAARNFELSNAISELQKQLLALDKKAPDYASKAAELEAQMESLNSELSYNQYLLQNIGTGDDVVKQEKKIAEVQEAIAGFEEYKAEMEAQKNTSENTILDEYDKQQFSADMELASMTYKDAQEQYNTAQKGIVAEFDGIITECMAVQGSMVAEGTQLLTMENCNALKVSFSASQQTVQKLAIGQKAEITIAGNHYEGEISKINRMASVGEANTPMVGVEVHITNPDDKIILGMDAKLTVYTSRTENALLVPVEVINADKNGDFLYVVEDGVIVRKSIVCGISTDTYAEVLEGITEEDQIVLTSFGDIEEGMAVTIMPSQSLGEENASANDALSVSITME